MLKTTLFFSNEKMAYKYNQRITAEIISMEIPEDDDCDDEGEDDDDGIPKVSSLKRNLIGG